MSRFEIACPYPILLRLTDWHQLFFWKHPNKSKPCWSKRCQRRLVEPRIRRQGGTFEKSEG